MHVSKHNFKRVRHGLLMVVPCHVQKHIQVGWKRPVKSRLVKKNKYRGLCERSKRFRVKPIRDESYKLKEYSKLRYLSRAEGTILPYAFEPRNLPREKNPNAVLKIQRISNSNKSYTCPRLDAQLVFVCPVPGHFRHKLVKLVSFNEGNLRGAWHAIST